LSCINILDIADLPVTITSKCSYFITDSYLPFFSSSTSKKPTFRIDITSGKASLEIGTHYPSTFDSGGTWKLYRKSDHESFIVSGSRTFSFDETGTTGTIFTESIGDDAAAIRGPIFPFDELLYVRLLTKYSGIIAHACGIIHNGKGEVFVGASGNGKSTMAKLWMNEPNCTILNDERIIIREIHKEFFAYGTPWHGELPVCNQGKVPVQRLFFLQHADENYARRISPTDAVARLIVRSFPAIWDQEGMNANLDFMAGLSEEIPCYELGFVPDESAISFLREFAG